MKYVNCMGCLYRLSDAAYVKMLKGIITDEPELQLSKLGKYLGYIENVTDMDWRQAGYELTDMDKDFDENQALVQKQYPKATAEWREHEVEIVAEPDSTIILGQGRWEGEAWRCTAATMPKEKGKP